MAARLGGSRVQAELVTMAEGDMITRERADAAGLSCRRRDGEIERTRSAPGAHAHPRGDQCPDSRGIGHHAPPRSGRRTLPRRDAASVFWNGRLFARRWPSFVQDRACGGIVGSLLLSLASAYAASHSNGTRIGSTPAWNNQRVALSTPISRIRL